MTDEHGNSAAPSNDRAAETGTTSAMERACGAPSHAAKVWIYWWWLNGCVTKDGILRDLDTCLRPLCLGPGFA